MTFNYIAAAAVFATVFGVTPAHAQNQQSAQVPAEIPPASYKANQYVDSKGCVYIRAGIDGNVTWVPRVDSQRQLICDQTPSQVARDVPATAPVKQEPTQLAVEAAPTPAQKNQKPTSQTAAASASTPKPQKTTAPSAKPASTAVKSTIVAASNQPKPAVAATKKQPSQLNRATPSPAPAPTVFKSRKGPDAKPAVTTASSQRGISTQRRTASAPSPAPAPTVFRSSRKSVVISPQAPAAQSTATTQTAAANRFVPAHVNKNNPRGNTPQIPEGYRPAWDDDRLNPRRAEQTQQGVASMGLIWTNTVPRRLINK